MMLVAITMSIAGWMSAQTSRVAQELGDRGYDLEEQIRKAAREIAGWNLANETGRMPQARMFTFFKVYENDVIYGAWWSNPLGGDISYVFWNSVDTIGYNGLGRVFWVCDDSGSLYKLTHALLNGENTEEFDFGDITVMRIEIKYNRITDTYRITNAIFDTMYDDREVLYL